MQGFMGFDGVNGYLQTPSITDSPIREINIFENRTEVKKMLLHFFVI